MKLGRVLSFMLAFGLGSVAALGVRAAVAAPMAPPQSAPPPVAPPSIQPAVPQTLQAAQLAERAKYYTVSKSFKVSGPHGAHVATDVVACNSPYDLFISGYCEGTSFTQLRSTRVYNAAGPMAAVWECQFETAARDQPVSATIICKRP